MPGNLPATGSEITFGRVNKAYTNQALGAAGNAPAGGLNISLSSVLGNNATYGIGQAVGTSISLSSRFGGRSYPYTY